MYANFACHKSECYYHRGQILSSHAHSHTNALQQAGGQPYVPMKALYSSCGEDNRAG